jgi:hypothetical protein
MFIKLVSKQFPWLEKNEDFFRTSSNVVIFVVSSIAFGIAIWDTGFPQSDRTQEILDNFYTIYFACNGLLYVIRSLLFFREHHFSAVVITNLALGLLLLFEYSFSLILGKPYILSAFFHLPPIYKSLTVLLFVF